MLLLNMSNSTKSSCIKLEGCVCVCVCVGGGGVHHMKEISMESVRKVFGKNTCITDSLRYKERRTRALSLSLSHTHIHTTHTPHTHTHTHTPSQTPARTHSNTLRRKGGTVLQRVGSALECGQNCVHSLISRLRKLYVLKISL